MLIAFDIPLSLSLSPSNEREKTHEHDTSIDLKHIFNRFTAYQSEKLLSQLIKKTD